MFNNYTPIHERNIIKRTFCNGNGEIEYQLETEPNNYADAGPRELICRTLNSREVTASKYCGDQYWTGNSPFFK